MTTEMRFKAYEKNWLKVSRDKTEFLEFTFKNEAGGSGIDRSARPAGQLIINKSDIFGYLGSGCAREW